MNISAKFQLYPSYSFWGVDFWIFCANFAFWLPWQPVKLRGLDKKYRRLSLPQSPGDQTKYFELSVVWDSQFVTSFTLYMYTDCLDHRDYNLHVHVFGNDILEFNTLWLSCSFVTLILRRLRQKLKNLDDYLHQRTPLNSVHSLKLQRHRYVHFG